MPRITSFYLLDGTNLIQHPEALLNVASAQVINSFLVRALLPLDLAHFSRGEPSVFLEDPEGVAPLDAPVLPRVARQHHPGILFFGDSEHRVHGFRTNEAGLINPHHATCNSGLPLTADEETLDGVGILEPLTPQHPPGRFS